MSFDVFFQCFDSGDSAPVDAGVLESSLAPYVAERDDKAGYLRLRFSDGEADLYGADGLSNGFMVNHASGSEVWDVLMAVARRTGQTILPMGCPAVVTTEEGLAHLPSDLAADAVVLQSGADLKAHVEKS